MISAEMLGGKYLPYLAVAGHGITQITFQNMLIALRGGRAEDGGRGAGHAGHLQQLRLNVVDGLGEVEEEVCFVSIFSVIEDLERELQPLVTTHRVLVEVSMRRN